MHFPWIISALTTALMWAITNVFDQIVQREYAKDFLSLIVVTTLSRLPVAGLAFFMFGFHLPEFPILALSLLYGACLLVPIFCYIQAIHVEEATRVILFSQSKPMVAYLFAFVFLGEVLSWVQFLGVLLLIGAAVLSVYRPLHLREKAHHHFGSAFFWISLSVIGFALTDVLLKYCLRFYPSSQLMLPWSYVGGFLAIVPMMFFSPVRKLFVDGSFAWFRRGWGFFLLSIIPGIAGFFFLFRSFTDAPVALVSSVLSLQPLFLSLLFLVFSPFFKILPREQFHGAVGIAKFVACALSVSGIYLILS